MIDLVSAMNTWLQYVYGTQVEQLPKQTPETMYVVMLKLLDAGK